VSRGNQAGKGESRKSKFNIFRAGNTYRRKDGARRFSMVRLGLEASQVATACGKKRITGDPVLVNQENRKPGLKR